MTSIGAPTMALNYRINPFTGEYMPPSTDVNLEAYVSWPKRGKHLSFDGRYLHAAPKDLMPHGLFEQQIEIRQDITDTSERKRLSRRHRRVTFLVNIWLNYKPFNVDKFPDSMIDKLTAVKEDVPHILFRKNVDSEACPVKVVKTGNFDTSSVKTTAFKWPMGGCGSNEVISMELPLESIQSEIHGHGNLRLICEHNSDAEKKCVSIVLESTENESLKQEHKRQKV
jgi:hypothetical protein